MWPAEYGQYQDVKEAGEGEHTTMGCTHVCEAFETDHAGHVTQPRRSITLLALLLDELFTLLFEQLLGRVTCALLIVGKINLLKLV